MGKQAGDAFMIRIPGGGHGAVAGEERTALPSRVEDTGCGAADAAVPRQFEGSVGAFQTLAPFRERYSIHLIKLR
jgi:hypothetical protein